MSSCSEMTDEATIPLAAVTRYPSPLSNSKRFASKGAKIQFIAEKVREILEAVGLDLDHPSLTETPQRVAEMYIDELFAGLDVTNFPSLTYFEERCAQEQPSVIRIEAIEVQSTCEHHLLPIIGQADIAYLPKGHLLGLSKVHRLVDFFARRPQLQERLTAQVADSLAIVLSTQDVAVQISAWHGCIGCRGIKHRDSRTTTTVRHGIFEAENPFKP